MSRRQTVSQLAALNSGSGGGSSSDGATVSRRLNASPVSFQAAVSYGYDSMNTVWL